MSPLTDMISLATGLLVMFAVPGYCALQIWAPMRLSEGWRAAALAPLALAVPLQLWCAYAFVDRSNLWPVPFMLFAPFATTYLALVLAIGRKRQLPEPV